MCDSYSCIFYRNFNLNRTENVAQTLKNPFFLHWISLNKLALESNFRTSLRRHNVIENSNVFANKSIGEMISQGGNAFPCNVMQANQGPDKLCQAKSHETACKSHDFNMDFATSNSSGVWHVTNSYARMHV